MKIYSLRFSYPLPLILPLILSQVDAANCYQKCVSIPRLARAFLSVSAVIAHLGLLARTARPIS